jgi:hypothetical protein
MDLPPSVTARETDHLIAGLLRPESLCQPAQSATGQSAITSEHVGLSADELGSIGFAAQAAMVELS